MKRIQYVLALTLGIALNCDSAAFGVDAQRDITRRLDNSGSMKRALYELKRNGHAGAIQSVFNQINRSLQDNLQPSKSSPPVALTESAKPATMTAKLSEYTRWIKERSTLLIALGAVLGLLGVAIITQRKRRFSKRPRREPGESVHSSEQGGARKYTLPAMLVDLSGITQRTNHDISGKLTWISRARHEDTENVRTLVIKDDTISREHAVIEYRDFGYWISDRGSINGTFVNDEEITSEKLLKRGDRVRFAKYEFEFVMPQRADMEDTVMVKIPRGEEQTVLVAASTRNDAIDPAKANQHEESPLGANEEEKTIIQPPKGFRNNDV